MATGKKSVKKKRVKKTQSKRKDIIGFILRTTWDDRLAREFFSKRTAKDLFNFFQEEGYTDIKEKPDCVDILKFRKDNIGETIPAYGQDPCPSNAGY